MPKSSQEINDLHLLGLSQESVYQTDILNSTQIEVEVTVAKKEVPELVGSGTCAGIGSCFVSPILAEPIISDNANNYLVGAEMSEQPKFIGDYRIPRWLSKHPAWTKAPCIYRMVLVTIIEHALYEPTKFDDFGMEIDVGIGQFCCSRKELLTLCGKGCDDNQIKRAIDHFCKKRPGFVQVLSKEVTNQRMLLTVSFLVSYDKKNITSDQGGDQVLSKFCPTKEESKNLNHKKKNKKENAVGADAERLVSLFESRLKNMKPDWKLGKDWTRKAGQCFQAMIDKDKRDPLVIEKVIWWLMAQDSTHQFYRGKIETPLKFRRQFDSVELKSKEIKSSGKLTANDLIRDYQDTMGYSIQLEHGTVFIYSPNGQMAQKFPAADVIALEKFLNDRGFVKR